MVEKTMENRLWQGRLSVHVEGIDTQAAQSLSGAFELRGNAQTGSLLLFTPLGSTAATLRWAPGTASLQSGGQTQEFGDLRELTSRTVGTELPLEALFAWLRGESRDAAGWSADLGQYTQGRFQARHQANPAAELRVVLDP